MGCGAARSLPFKAAADGREELQGADKTLTAITAAETSCRNNGDEGCDDGEYDNNG